MYIVNMVQTKTIYQLKEERLQILFGKITEVRDWHIPTLKASFWRCYCPLDKGGQIIFQEKEIPLLPGKAYIIPPLTDFQSKNTNTFSKSYCHFAYGARNLSFTPGIYPFALPPEALRELRDFKKNPNKIKKSTIELLMLQLISKGLVSIPAAAKQELLIDERIQKLLDLMKENKNQRNNEQ